jgi:hypothetical protein
MLGPVIQQGCSDAGSMRDLRRLDARESRMPLDQVSDRVTMTCGSVAASACDYQD